MLSLGSYSKGPEQAAQIRQAASRQNRDIANQLQTMIWWSPAKHRRVRRESGTTLALGAGLLRVFTTGFANNREAILFHIRTEPVPSK